MTTDAGRVDQDTARRSSALDHYGAARRTFHELFGYELAISGATLLAHARDELLAAHGHLDALYLSRHHDAHEVRGELLDIACTLVAHGADVHVTPHSTLRWDGPHGAVVELATAWTTGEHVFVTPAGGGPYACVLERGFVEVEIDGRAVLAPHDRNGLLEALYGSDWRTSGVPPPRSVQPAAREATAAVRLDEVDLARVHWTRFYGEQRPMPGPSPFAAWVAEQIPAELTTVLELGCGNGRDTAAVARGRRALGLDYSPTAIARNERVWPGIDFRQADVGDPESLARATADHVGSHPVAVYSRFFVHAISDEAEDVLREFLARTLPAGSRIYLEFRTEKDKDTPKVFGEHFRRFVDPDALVARFGRDGHFAVLHDERGHGLAVYRDEDPYVARIVLEKRTDQVR